MFWLNFPNLYAQKTFLSIKENIERIELFLDLRIKHSIKNSVGRLKEETVKAEKKEEKP